MNERKENMLTGKFIRLPADGKPEVVEAPLPLTYEELKRLMDDKLLTTVLLAHINPRRTIAMFCDDEALLTNTPVNPWATILYLRALGPKATNICGTCVIVAVEDGEELPLTDDEVEAWMQQLQPATPTFQVLSW